MQAVSHDFSMTCHALGIRVPPQVEVALARAVAIDPTTRQKSVGELWDQLKTSIAASSRRRGAQPPAAVTADMSPATVWDPRGAAMLDPAPVAAPPPSMPFQGTAMMLDAPSRPSPLASTAPISAPQVALPPRYATAPPAPSHPAPRQIAPPLPPLPVVAPPSSRTPLIVGIVVGAVALIAVLALLALRIVGRAHHG
jgi:hypothetical protein